MQWRRHISMIWLVERGKLIVLHVQRRRHKSMIWLVERRKIIVLHASLVFSFSLVFYFSLVCHLKSVHMLMIPRFFLLVMIPHWSIGTCNAIFSLFVSELIAMVWRLTMINSSPCGWVMPPIHLPTILCSSIIRPSKKKDVSRPRPLHILAPSLFSCYFLWATFFIIKKAFS